jgi:hypothetical protein
MNLDELSLTKHEIKKMKNPKHDTNIIQIISLKSMTMYVKTTIIPTKPLCFSGSRTCLLVSINISLNTGTVSRNGRNDLFKNERIYVF